MFYTHPRCPTVLSPRLQRTPWRRQLVILFFGGVKVLDLFEDTNRISRLVGRIRKSIRVSRRADSWGEQTLGPLPPLECATCHDPHAKLLKQLWVQSPNPKPC